MTDPANCFAIYVKWPMARRAALHKDRWVRQCGGSVSRIRNEVTRETVLRAAELVGIKIAREHRPGVIRNLETLLAHAEVLSQVHTDAAIEPAPAFRP